MELSRVEISRVGISSMKVGEISSPEFGELRDWWGFPAQGLVA